ncbi:ankyrin repeat domain-containing protein SOWAHB [Denticeps clupeoides]|uniref:ankyrin repeat domain-containing protein SOWAHB n=1 Tax=Denticeps clupeoides TaxID=299321 RepID=UPI0010A460B0|nr:ankyrin repeat domain-containing protein SOWAHB [Denticeps clupeoides]
MAAGFSQDSVLGFLLRSGGAVRNSELLAHFRPYLREHENREHNRELFKKFVNAVAVVKHQEGTPYILLKKRYSADAGRPPVRHEEGHKPREAPNPDPKASSHAPRERGPVLPAAGLVNRNNNNVEAIRVPKPVKAAPAGRTDRTDRNGGTCVARQPAVDSTETKRQSFEEAGNKRPGLPSDLEHNGVEAGRTGAARRPDHAAREVRSSEAAAAPPQAGPRCRGSGEGATTWVPHHLQGQAPGVPHNTPTPPARGDLPERTVPAAHFLPESEEDGPAGPQRRGRPLEASSSQESLTSSESDWTQAKAAWHSAEGLDQRGDHGVDERVRQMLQRPQEVGVLPALRRPARQTNPLHHSTGHLDEEAASAPGTPRPPAHRMHSRISRSLGSDLDKPFLEDSESARYSRLQRISSSLSATYRVSTPPRLHGSRDGVSLSEASSTQSLSEQRSPAVPLPPREHEWLVKAASADWPDVYSLFREDNSLLNKKDFISGYTIVHWIAKHGDHRVLNTLSYGVAKAGMKLDVDARSVGGYTPLHLAAIHGHKKVISLLVHKFQADVALRDASGRKAWQYLSKDASGDVVQLLRAPQSKAAAAGPVPPSYDVTLLVPRPATGPAAVKRHSSLAALFKHKSLARVTAHSEFAV